MTEGVFAAYAIMVLPLFYFVEPARAVAITCFAGWLLLPVGNFPVGSATATFPYWITGTAVPSDMLLTKMWWPPVIALLGALLADAKSFLRFRLSWIDFPMVMLFVWPILQWAFVSKPEPASWIASLYVAAAWATPWFLGRIYFSGCGGGRLLIYAVMAGLAVIAPIAMIEGYFGPRIYEWLYDVHPFRFDGVERYIGFRPIGLFEHGNQYGIWAAITAFAAIWVWQTTSSSSNRCFLAAVAALAAIVAMASQSVGAILLLIVGLALWWGAHRPWMRILVVLIAFFTATAGGIYLSGVIPLRAIAENTAIGREVVNLARVSGRSSFTWRIARDQTALKLIGEHPIIGAARWDWWRENGERPWSLSLMIIGQFGMIGLTLTFGSLLIPVLRTLARYLKPNTALAETEAALAGIVLIAMADGILNSFFFYPAIVAAGALVNNGEGLREHRGLTNLS